MPSSYRNVYQASLQNPESFWAQAAAGIEWDRTWDEVLDRRRAPLYAWFSGARMNTCFNALDRHVRDGRGEQAALVYDSAMTGVSQSYTYRELTAEVARCAGMLRQQGVAHGDRVIVYMPMIPQAVIAMLACARLGAVHSVVFGGFAARELAKRIRDSQPKIILSASCGLEPQRVVAYKPLLDEAIAVADAGDIPCIVVQRPQQVAVLKPGRDHDWDQQMRAATPADCVSVAATDPLYVLYTSGTTGKPKGVVRTNGDHAVALRWSMANIYDMRPGDVFWAASDVGWVVGHSYIVYAPLLHGCTTVLYEGKPVGTPDAGAFWRVIEDHKVNCLFTAPTAFRAIRREDSRAELLPGYDLSSLRSLFLAGERCDPSTLHWAEDKLHVPVVDHWWQTETGWPVAANPLGIEPQPVKPGSPTLPVPGFNVRVLNEDGSECEPGRTGNVVMKLPLPPGALATLWQNDTAYKDSYLVRYPGYYLSGDAGFMDEDGYVWIMSRTDDIINVAGHRLSTGQIEEVLAAHPDVAECAVIGVRNSLKGEVPVGLVVVNTGAAIDAADLESQLVRAVRDDIGPVAAFKTALSVKRLPKTRSGKVLRATMRKIANGENFELPATIDDPAILDEIGAALAARGLPG